MVHPCHDHKGIDTGDEADGNEAQLIMYKINHVGQYISENRTQGPKDD